jgi:hypothetical protein
MSKTKRYEGRFDYHASCVVIVKAENEDVAAYMAMSVPLYEMDEVNECGRDAFAVKDLTEGTVILVPVAADFEQ